jgi:molybdopterin-guanine dinucleotide biosynthesis protein A
MKPVFGLVVCGGKSSRMGEDKSLLNYNGTPQRYHVYELLRPLCEKVFLSCNREQAKTIPEKYNVILDALRYENIGPMAALLSAFDLHDRISFICAGCDYPFVKKEDLQKLIDARNEHAIAVSYFNNAASLPEPLLAVYESTSYDFMKENFEDKKYSLRYFLEEIKALKVFPSSADVLTGVNNREQYEEALKRIQLKNN